jgi:hypothetical protein
MTRLDMIKSYVSKCRLSGTWKGHTQRMKILSLLQKTPGLTAARFFSGHRTYRSADVLDTQPAWPDGIENLAGLLGS